LALIWSPGALDDVQELIRFLDDATGDNTAGNRVASVILEAADRLLEQPHIGKPARDDMRERFSVFGAGAYVLRYRVMPKGDILVIRVWHSREDRDLR
jgi:toxin ParE1/3/4